MAKKTRYVKFSISLIIFMLLLAIAQTSKATVYENKFEYDLKSGVAVITKYIENQESVAIPDEIAGTTRIYIEEGTFTNANLKKVVILKNVKKIAKDAFAEGVKAIIYGKEESVAQKYSKENNFEFRIYGDINGDGKVTATDLLKIKKHIVEVSGELINENEQDRADVNCDEKTTTTDLLIVKKVIVGLDETEEPDDNIEDIEEEEAEEIEEPEKPEEYVKITYITDAKKYPEFSPEDEQWKKDINTIIKKIKRSWGHLHKDISAKEYTVLKGSKVTITNERPAFITNEQPPANIECGDTWSYYRVHFLNSWIADKFPEIVNSPSSTPEPTATPIINGLQPKVSPTIEASESNHTVPSRNRNNS